MTGSSGTTRFRHDGDALVAEYVSGAMTRRYVHNEGADVPLLSYAGTGVTQPSYLHADHQGSIVAVSTTAGTTAINTYDEYGIPGASNTGRFQYTGQIWLPELGMYHYKARIYSPTLGRFLQTDPVGYEDQFNLYAYVGNDPLNMTDPSGRQSCKSPPCPDIPLSLAPRATRDRMASRVGRSTTGGNERGMQLYRKSNGEEREARRGYPTGGDFAHIIQRRANEVLVMLTHTHNGSDEKGTAGRALTSANNAPSVMDQQAMHNENVPIQLVGPYNTGTLYRENNQDYYAVEAGDPERVPNLSSQHIIVVDRRIEPGEDEERREPQ